MEENKKEFIRQVRMLVQFWENNEKCSNVKERLDGMVFSLLYLLDGKSDGLKDYVIAPNKEIENNISGNLSDMYYEIKRSE